MIEIKNLTKRFGKIVAVDDISFSAKKGEILGFLGPNGAGKSTTMNIITGYIPATKGTVEVDGYDIFEQPQEVKKRIGYLPEKPPLYDDMTVVEYLKFVFELKKVDKKNQTEDIIEILKITGITDHMHRLIKNLSKGYRQRVGLAQALIGNPKILILDEPTVGLDPKQIIEIRKLIKTLGEQHTIILSSHILTEVSAVCDRIVIISKGKITAIDTTENLSKGIAERLRLALTIAGPKNSVMKHIKSIYGIKYFEPLVEREDGSINYVIEAEEGIDIRKQIFFEMAKAGYPILEMRSMDMSLEDIFINYTNENKEVN